jgi:hypothetical protein
MLSGIFFCSKFVIFFFRNVQRVCVSDTVCFVYGIVMIFYTILICQIHVCVDEYLILNFFFSLQRLLLKRYI